MALFVPEGESPFPRSILEKPEIKKYYEAFGSGLLDLAVLARSGNQRVGLIWGRTYSSERPSYGFISEDIPEISMAVQTTFRNQGIGTALLNEILSLYTEKGVKAISLSVDKRNPVRRLYKRLGFELFSEKGTSVTMVKHLLSP